MVSDSWSAPLLGFYKLNVDAAFSSSDGRASCGMVVRDCQGQVIISANRLFMGYRSALQAELWAILLGLEVAFQHSLLVQLVESDSQLAILEIKKGLGSSPPWFSIVLDNDYYRIFCGVHDFCHIRRAANELAHRVAKSHGLQDVSSVWQFSLPLAMIA
ncbi:hypothetical protein PTKIN_Ptkin09bG0189900 [Pterospermum kingtungense]